MGDGQPMIKEHFYDPAIHYCYHHYFYSPYFL